MLSPFKFVILFLIFFLSATATTAQSIDWLTLEEAQSKASKNGKKVLLFSEADWCSYCAKMYKEVFPQQSVVDSLQKYFYPVRIDIESEGRVQFNNQNYTEKSLARKLRAIRTPTTIFIDSEGSVIGTQPGFLPANIFDKLLAFVGNELYNNITFEEYITNQEIGTK